LSKYKILSGRRPHVSLRTHTSMNVPGVRYNCQIAIPGMKSIDDKANTHPKNSAHGGYL